MNFSINLDGDMASKAKADADALQRLNDALRAEQRALSGMEAQMRAIQKAGVVDIALYRQLSGAIQSQRDNVAKLTAQQVSFGTAAFQSSAAMSEEASKSSVLATAIGNTLAGAFLKLAGAVKKAVSSIYEFAEARGDTERMLETVFRSEKAAEHTYDVIRNISGRIAISQAKTQQVADSLAAAGMVNGDRMVAAIEAVGKAEAARKGAGQVIEGIITRAQRSKWFSVSRDELYKSGLTFQDLANTISKKTGQGMQEALLALRVGRVDLRTGLDALNETIEKRLGGIAQKKFLTIGYQATRLKETFGNLFAKVDTSKIAGAMNMISNWLDTSSVGGAALQEIFNAAIDTLGDAIEAVWPYAQAFFEFLMLTALKVYNAFYPLRKALKEIFGDPSGVQSFEDALLGLSDVVGNVASFIADNAVPMIAAAIAYKLTPIVASLVSSLWAVAPAAWAAAAPFLAAAAPFVAWGLAIGGVYLLFKNLIDMIQSVDWGYVWDKIRESLPSADTIKALATNLIDGLVNGIASGATRFVDAMKSMGEKGLKAFKNFFGIASPAKVMEIQGKYLDQGLERGIAANSNGSRDALAEAAGSPSEVRELGSNQAAAVNSVTNNNSSSVSGPTVTFSEGSIVINIPGGGGSAAEQLRAEMPQIMADVFEQLGFSMGAARVA